MSCFNPTQRLSDISKGNSIFEYNPEFCKYESLIIIGAWIDTYVFYQSVLQKKTWIWSLCVAKM